MKSEKSLRQQREYTATRTALAKLENRCIDCQLPKGETHYSTLCEICGSKRSENRRAKYVLRGGRKIAPVDRRLELLRRRADEIQAQLMEERREAQRNPSCGSCGGPHNFDTVVPSAMWNDVIRRFGSSEYLCLQCIIIAFAKVGKSFTAILVGEDFNFLPIEIRINDPRLR